MVADYDGITMTLSFDADDGSPAAQNLGRGKMTDFAVWSQTLEAKSDKILAARALAERQRGLGDRAFEALASLNERVGLALKGMSVDNARQNLNDAGQMFQDEYKVITDALNHLQDVAQSGAGQSPVAIRDSRR